MDHRTGGAGDRRDHPLTPISRKAETRRRIVDAAARLFVERDAHRVGVDEIMQACGLTHGGFYGYFPNKAALLSEACAAALRKTLGPWRMLARRLDDDAHWRSHLDVCLAGELTSANPACPVAILGADMARCPDAIDAGYVEVIRLLIERIADEMGGDRRRATLSVAALVGATLLAGQVGGDKALAAEILNATRDGLIGRP